MTTVPDSAVDVTAFYRVVRLAGLELPPERVEALYPVWAAMLRADRRLAKLDLSAHAARGAPWGNVDDDS